MNEMNAQSSTTESVVILHEASSMTPISSTSSSNNTDDEVRRRKILSKLWGKGNKSSHKVRELDKGAGHNSADSSVSHDHQQKQLFDNANDLSACSATNELRSSGDENANSINSSKPLAVVKPIVVMKSGIVISSSLDRPRAQNEASSVATSQADATTTAAAERQRSTTPTNASAVSDRTSSKKKRSHKDKDSKKKKTTKEKSTERERSDHHRSHQEKDKSSKGSSSKTHHSESNQKDSKSNDRRRSSERHAPSSHSSSKKRRQSPSNENCHGNQRSSRSTASKKDEPSSSKKAASSSAEHHRHHTNSKQESDSKPQKPSGHSRHDSLKVRSPSPTRFHQATKTKEGLPTKIFTSPTKSDRDSRTKTKSDRPQNDLPSHSKSTTSVSPSNFQSKAAELDTNAAADENSHQPKTRQSDENLTNSSKSQKPIDVSSEQRHRHSPSPPARHEKRKTISNDLKAEINPEKASRHDRRSSSQRRSKSKEHKGLQKSAEQAAKLNDASIEQTQINNEINSMKTSDHIHSDRKQTIRSSIPSSSDDYSRKSSDYHRYDRHLSPFAHDDRRNGSRHHRISSGRSYHSRSHYSHRHHRSPSPRRYHHHRAHRRSISPRSRHHRSRYFSSTSSSFSSSPRHRSSSRTSSNSSRRSSSYSSVSRRSSSSSSSSSSRHRRYYHHKKKFRRSPTLEKIFLKASESIESVSIQKNPTALSTSTAVHSIPVQTATVTSDMQLPPTMGILPDADTFYAETFSGFSAPPPPFMVQPQQRCLKEIATESSIPPRPVLNELQSVQLPTVTVDDSTLKKVAPSTDISNNVRPTSNKPPRISRFSDITPVPTPEPPLNTNLPLDTVLNYTQISENINYLPANRRQQKRRNREVMECECTTSEYDRSRGIKACGHECLNRMLLIECGPLCPCGQWCTNRRFQRRSYASHRLALFKTEMKGYGLRTIAPIRKGRFLIEYVGEVIDMDELTKRNKKYKRDGHVHQYVMSLVHGTVIDSTVKGNWARFINHSCEPNCVAEKWLVNGEYRMGIFSKRDLNPDEEITIDYRFETSSTTADSVNQKCYCGAPTCRGTISVKNNNNATNNSSSQRQTRLQPLDDKEILECLFDEDANEYIIPKTVEEIRQLIQIMSRTESENVRTIELDLIRNGSQKQIELPRLFLECNGLRVLCSWMKDILIDDDEQQYSVAFKCYLLDIIQCVLPIKDRTIVAKNGLLDLVCNKLKLPATQVKTIGVGNREQISSLMNAMLDHLSDPIVEKLFHLYSTWMSLKERFVIPKRKEPESSSDHYHHHRHHHHHHHRHHDSKYLDEENNYRSNYSARVSTIQQKPNDRSFSRRSFTVRETPRTQEQQLSKDERRRLFEQQYEDAERARAAAAMANSGSPGSLNEPPQKKQRTLEGAESMTPSTPPQSQSWTPVSLTTSASTLPSNTYPHEMDQMYWIHQHLSQIPTDYIRSYMISIGQSVSASNVPIEKDEPPLPPPARPDSDIELARIIHLPPGWSVAVCPSDSSVYFYNRQTMETSWTTPVLEMPKEHSPAVPVAPPTLELSPLSSSQIIGHHRSHHDQKHVSSSSLPRPSGKISKHAHHRHNRTHRHHHTNIIHKAKPPSTVASFVAVKAETHTQPSEEAPVADSTEQLNEHETDNMKPVEQSDELSSHVRNPPTNDNSGNGMSITVKEDSSDANEHAEKPGSNASAVLSSIKANRDHLRKSISQHVHTTLKPYTKRTCKQGRIVSTDDIKYLVKKFTLAVLDKEIEKAKNEGTPLSSTLSDRVRLKTEVYVKKYMNKVGPTFQRHETISHQSSQPLPQTASTSNTS